MTAARGPALALEGIVKRFGAATALDGAVARRGAPAPSTPSSARTAPARPRSCASRSACSRPTPGRSRSTARGRAAVRLPRRRHRRRRRHGAPALHHRPRDDGGGERRPRRDAARTGPRRAAERVRQSPTPPASRSTRPPVAAHPTVAAQQRLEIVKALARDARLLILDEPAAVLAPEEAGELLGWLRRFVDGGATVVLITHKLRDALAVADDVTVLRRGRTVGAQPAASATEASPTSLMLGPGAPRRPRSPSGPRPPPDRRRSADRDRALGSGPAPRRGRPRRRRARRRPRPRREPRRPCRRARRRRGVEGSGQHELLRLLAGRLAPTAGTARAAAPASPSSPRTGTGTPCSSTPP